MKSKKGLLVIVTFICLLSVLAGCNFIEKQVGLTNARLLHDGFDFSEGKTIGQGDDYKNEDGRIVWWDSSYVTNPDYSYGDYVWWDNGSLDTVDYKPQVYHYGEISINAAIEAGLSDVTWDKGPFVPLLVNHVYAAKCADGYVIFVVKAVKALDENAEGEENMPYADVDYIFSTTVNFE